MDAAQSALCGSEQRIRVCMYRYSISYVPLHSGGMSNQRDNLYVQFSLCWHTAHCCPSSSPPDREGMVASQQTTIRPVAPPHVAAHSTARLGAPPRAGSYADSVSDDVLGSLAIAGSVSSSDDG